MFILFLFMCVALCVLSHKGQNSGRSLGAGATGGCEPPSIMVGTELGSFGGAASVINCLAITLVFYLYF